MGSNSGMLLSAAFPVVGFGLGTLQWKSIEEKWRTQPRAGNGMSIIGRGKKGGLKREGKWNWESTIASNRKVEGDWVEMKRRRGSEETGDTE